MPPTTIFDVMRPGAGRLGARCLRLELASLRQLPDGRVGLIYRLC